MVERIPFPSDLAERFQVRMPAGLRERIREAADANQRSMNAEIVARLEASFEPSIAEDAAVDVATRLLTNVMARVAYDMHEAGKPPEEFSAWMRSFPEFARYMPPKAERDKEP